MREIMSARATNDSDDDGLARGGRVPAMALSAHPTSKPRQQNKGAGINNSTVNAIDPR